MMTDVTVLTQIFKPEGGHQPPSAEAPVAHQAGHSGGPARRDTDGAAAGPGPAGAVPGVRGVPCGKGTGEA